MWYSSLIFTMRTDKSAKQGIIFGPVCPCVCVRSYVRTVTEQLLVRNWCNLVEIYVIVSPRSD